MICNFFFCFNKFKATPYGSVGVGVDKNCNTENGCEMELCNLFFNYRQLWGDKTYLN